MHVDPPNTTDALPPIIYNYSIIALRYAQVLDLFPNELFVLIILFMKQANCDVNSKIVDVIAHNQIEVIDDMEHPFYIILLLKS